MRNEPSPLDPWLDRNERDNAVDEWASQVAAEAIATPASLRQWGRENWRDWLPYALLGLGLASYGAWALLA